MGVPLDVCNQASKEWDERIAAAIKTFEDSYYGNAFTYTPIINLEKNKGYNYSYRPTIYTPPKATMTPTQKKLQAILEVSTEFDAASGAFPAFNSAHEGYSILAEEVDELWDEVKKNPAKRVPANLEKEAIQVAAMALRFLVDVCYKGK